LRGTVHFEKKNLFLLREGHLQSSTHKWHRQNN
jgi:hypothetical protein